MSGLVWAEELSTASFGGVEIDVLTTEDTIARAIIRHTYARKDGGDLIDMGAEPRVTDARILFFERAPEREDTSPLNHLQRYAAFLAVASRGTPQTFVHPITGRYQALVENLQTVADAEMPDCLEVSCTFVEDTTAPAAFDGGRGSTGASVAAVITEASLVEAEGDDELTARAKWIAATVAAWNEVDVGVRRVNAELGSLSASIDDAIDAYDLATDPSKYYLFRTFQRLHYSARRAAERYRERQPRAYEITLTVAKPLRVLVAENYGAAEVEQRYGEIRDMNDIDDPSLLQAGTTLRVPARTASERAR